LTDRTKSQGNEFWKEGTEKDNALLKVVNVLSYGGKEE
jgi:hypothetical protein